MVITILVASLGVIAVAVIIWVFFERFQRKVPKLLDELFLRSTSLVSQQNQAVLSSEQSRIQSDLAKQQQQIEGMIKRVEASLEDKQKGWIQSEKERSASFAHLTTQLEEQRRVISDLQFSTKRISELLDNNQLRGAWGETVIEDLLQANGLQEGVHYARQQFIPETQLKPDIMLLLPEKTLIPVDVKFPFAELATLQRDGDQTNRKQLTKQFGTTLQLHLKKVAEYIQPSAGTLDFAILFIPSEMVFSFINQELPEVVEQAMRSRVLLVSPFTFIVVALTIKESYRNFLLSDTLRQAIGALQAFGTEWEKTKDAWDKHGRLIAQLQKSFEDVTGPRVRQLERKVAQIEKANKGIV